MRHMRMRTALSGVVLTAVALTASGCGDDSSPADDVPVLAEQLDRVDTAIAEGRYGEARKALDRIVEETAQARVAGTLDADEADAILDAVGDLVDELSR